MGKCGSDGNGNNGGSDGGNGGNSGTNFEYILDDVDHMAKVSDGCLV